MGHVAVADTGGRVKEDDSGRDHDTEMILA